LLGRIIGGVCGIVLILTLFSIFPPASPWAIWLPVALLTGAINAVRQNRRNTAIFPFLNGIITADVGGSMGMIMTSLLVGGTISALAALSMIPAAAAATAFATLHMLLPFVPVALLAVSTISELIYPGSFLNTFDRVFYAPIQVTKFICGHFFGTIGRIMDWRHARATPQPATNEAPAIVSVENHLERRAALRGVNPPEPANDAVVDERAGERPVSYQRERLFQAAIARRENQAPVVNNEARLSPSP
jgi:hypothetical protein